MGGGGGTERTLAQVIESLRREHTLTLYTVSRPPAGMGVRTRSRIPIRIPFFGLYQRALEGALLPAARGEDLLVGASGGLVVPGDPSRRAVVYCHGDFQDASPTGSKYRGIWALYYAPYRRVQAGLLARIGSPNVSLVSNSRYVQSSIRRLYGKDSAVVYPPVRIGEFDPGSAKSPQVATVSRYSPEKGLGFGLDVMSGSGHRYRVVGNTKTRSNVLYHARLARRAGGSPSISLERDIPRGQLVGILNESRVYFATSHETFGISVVEGIAAGCVPVVPDTGAHRETVPVDELRYAPGDAAGARARIDSAIEGRFDRHLGPLRDHIAKFDEARFRSSFRDLVSAALG